MDISENKRNDVSPSGGGSKGEGIKATKENHYLYKKELKRNANSLRHSMTKAEACLWKYALRAGQMNGYKFGRQRPVLNYIADFMCKEIKLVIEVDGYSHRFEEVIRNDEEKQKALEKAGFTLLRFSDDEVLNAIKRVRQVIWDTIEKLQPPPSPSVRGTHP